jgi:hypothetical protein
MVLSELRSASDCGVEPLAITAGVEAATPVEFAQNRAMYVLGSFGVQTFRK